MTEEFRDWINHLMSWEILNDPEINLWRYKLYEHGEDKKKHMLLIKERVNELYEIKKKGGRNGSGKD